MNALVLSISGCGDDGDGVASEGSDTEGLSSASFSPLESESGSADPGPEATGDGPETTGGAPETTGTGAQPPANYPVLDAPCQAPVAEPSRLVFTATDDSTGSVGLVELATRTVEPDLALAQTDLALAADEARVYVINRFGFDAVTILDGGSDLAYLGEFSVAGDADRSTNPHSLFVDDEDQAYITLFGDDALQIWDVADPEAPAPIGTLDLAAYADDDGIPEMGALIACGTVAFVAIERLDQNAGFAPVDSTWLVPIDLERDEVYDIAEEGVDGIELRGRGVIDYRLDPRDQSGHTLLVLDGGLEGVNLADGTTSWVIPEAAFTDAGIASRFQLRGFDLAADGTLYFVIANADFSAHAIWRATLEGGGEDLEPIVEGIQTVTGAMEVVGDEAWVADTTIGSSGLRVFDLSADPVTEIDGSPFGTGLPPYGLLPLE